jgi:hypothetical protein
MSAGEVGPSQLQPVWQDAGICVVAGNALGAAIPFCHDSRMMVTTLMMMM